MTENKKRRFVIIDGSSLMYRAFFALPLLTAPDGTYTNAIFGFTRMLARIFSDFQPDFAAIAFDKSRRTFRTELYCDYKGTREKTPSELTCQIPLVKKFAAVAGIPFIEADNYEADDIIGTLATQAAAANYDTFVITGDKDALQLIRPNLQVVITKKGISETKLFDEAAFQAAYGLCPLQLIDLKALMGDKSDNIPGVFGVGEKTATKLLTEYHSLTALYENIDKIKAGKLKEKLLNERENAFLSYKLATIECNMPLKFVPQEFTITPDSAKLTDFCITYGLKSVNRSLHEVLLPTGTATATSEPLLMPAEPVDCQLAEPVPAQLAELTDNIRNTGYFIYLPLTTGKIPHATCQGLAILHDKHAWYLSYAQHKQLLDTLLQDDQLQKITFDYKKTLACDLQPKGKIIDLLLLAYMLDSEAGDYSLPLLSEKYLGTALPPAPEKPTAIQLAAYWLKTVPVKALTDLLLEKVAAEQMLPLYDEMELPLEAVLISMEKYGLCIDKARLTQMAQSIGATISDLLGEIYDIAQCEFNVNSPKQLGEILFDRLDLPAQKKTKTGYSTNAAVLDNLRYAHPIINKILDFRMWSKLKSTYLDGMKELIDPQTNRIHTTFNQTVTATGRLSSSEPNLQNIPVRTEAGKKIRSLFVPGAGYDYFISADYSQIELRILAHLSDDPNFIASFRAEEDIHRRTASEIFGVAPEAVTDEQRRHAKAINFGLVYGKSDFGLAKELHISRQEAANYISSYFQKYAGVKKYLEKIVQDAHEYGYSTTLFGRRRYLPAINSKNGNLRAQAERMAMNTPIQGTAADIIKIAMLHAWRAIEKKQLQSRILLQVHDELVVETTADEVDIVKQLLRDTMQQAVALKVPLTVDINIGSDWASTK